MQSFLSLINLFFFLPTATGALVEKVSFCRLMVVHAANERIPKVRKTAIKVKSLKVESHLLLFFYKNFASTLKVIFVIDNSG